MSAKIYTDSIPLRYKSDDSKASGLAVSLWQNGVKVADLTQNAGKNWYYDFPAAIVNGTYDLYINNTPVKHNGIQETVRVIRSGIVEKSDIKDSSVDGNKIEQLSIDEPHIKIGAVTTPTMQAQSVDAGILADQAVTATKIPDATIKWDHFTQATKDTINSSGGGTITNNPDDVTLETKTGSKIGIKNAWDTVADEIALAALTGVAEGDRRHVKQISTLSNPAEGAGLFILTSTTVNPDGYAHFSSTVSGLVWKRQVPQDDALFWGFTPQNSAANNVTALQNALNGGNKTIRVTLPGTYQFDAYWRIYSNTELIFGAGVILSKVAGTESKNTFINDAAYNGGTNENIIIRGLTLKTNGIAVAHSLGDVLYAIRGELSFFNAKDVKIYNYTVKDLGTQHWGVGINSVENFLLQDFEIRGDKDAVMLQNSKNVIVRNGIVSTYDDRISLRGGDYPGVAKTLGDIDNVLVENIKDIPYPSQLGHFSRIIPAKWVSWYSGMSLRTGDTVENGGNVYRPLSGTSASPVTSTVAPTGTTRYFTTSDGIDWVYCQSDGALSATVKNVTFRNIEIGADRPGFMVSALEDTYMRAVYPGEVAPLVDNIVVENMIDNVLNNDVVFWLYAAITLKIINPRTRRKLVEARTWETSKGVDYDITIDNWTIDQSLYNAGNGDISVHDTKSDVYYRINTVKQIRDITVIKGLAVYDKIVSISGNASINEAFGLSPAKGDRIMIQGKERYFDGTKWNFPGRRALVLEIDPTISATFSANFLGTSGRSITVDFGDGTIKNYDLDPSVNVAVSHTYTVSNTCTILIYGDLNDLTKVDLSNYGYSVYFDIGQIADLINLTTLQLRGNNELQGDISLIKNMVKLTSCQLYQSALKGDLSVLANLPANALYIYAYGLTGGTITYTSTTLKSWNNTILRLQDNNLTASEVDQILIDLAAASVSGSTSQVRLDGSNAARTSASDAAVSTLTSNGWTVTTN